MKIDKNLIKIEGKKHQTINILTYIKHGILKKHM